jgi:hypothetical protein
VSLEEEDKAWLDRRAVEEQVSTTELIRRAIRRYRESEPEARTLRRLLGLLELLEETSGIWKGKDGLTYQIEVRGEWDER